MTTEPITEANAKLYLRLDDDDPGISLLGDAITAARIAVEEYLNASVVVQSRIEILDSFPADVIELPNGPVISITQIAYTDTNGDNQTVDSYILSDSVLSPAYGAAWPSTRDILGAVSITYSAGMMTGSPLVLEEKDLLYGIKLQLSDIWENRNGHFINASGIAINPALKNLINPYRRNMGV